MVSSVSMALAWLLKPKRSRVKTVIAVANVSFCVLFVVFLSPFLDFHAQQMWGGLVGGLFCYFFGENVLNCESWCEFVFNCFCLIC